MTLRGHLDRVEWSGLVGWAWDPELPARRVGLVVTVGDEVIARVLADRHRCDLEEAGISDGCAGFTLSFGERLSPLARHVIAVRREGDGIHLPGSPVVLEPAAAFEATRDAVARLLSAPCDDDALEERLDFLARETEELLRRRAERIGGGPARRPRWRALPGQEPTPELGPRALVIDDHVPRRERDAGSSAILSHARALHRLGYAVSFAAADLEPDDGILSREGIVGLGRPWYASVEEILSRHAGTFDVVYLHRLANAARYGGLVRHHQPRARLVYAVADLHHLRLARQALVEERQDLYALARRTRAAELNAALWADAVVTHSAAEADLLRRDVPAGRVHVVPWEVPVRPGAVPFSERRGVAFLGHYGHAPNVDAAQRLVEAVMPLVWARDPTIPCLLAGSHMPPAVRRLARPGVEIVGAVADLGQIFDRVRLTAAPLAYGAGLKGKVLDSLAAGLPCLCTPVAAEGLDLPDPLNRLTAADPPSFAANLIALHDDEALNQACAGAGLAFIRRAAGLEAVDVALARAVGRTGLSQVGANRSRSASTAA
ncbi:hypothetical protein NS228_16375 [Methylobacterium indicum]|uniref:glycosyltransferase n=1 Tax=Methylobacterium indicum TaxID=1775910 RepID=UPI00073416B4|nr:glycosyltransferase [Methylobacterium indicum]KTS31233.1 hypothetical protein NS229_14030 [Methylobacterium indicum]KTS38999.1 hypothetical protein NS228_16375 [Methylobacterium indicum]KTS51209.1 hypothetical protein NS230_14870 [Methylobacterium indicum]